MSEEARHLIAAFTDELETLLLAPTGDGFVALRRSLAHIEYAALVDRSQWRPSIPPPIISVLVCSAKGCNDTHAAPGGLFLVNNKWLCSVHLPATTIREVLEDGTVIERQVSRPVGWRALGD